MFDHRLPPPSKPYRLYAATGLLVLVGLFVAGRYWNAAFSATKKAQSPLSIKQPVAIPQLTILVFKSEKRMEVWSGSGSNVSMIRDYPVLAASGTSGPKLVEGDRQVPEGIYRIVEMNPNSRFHRSCKLNYPNEFDKKMAELDGRIKLGGDICIHGKNCSIGCVAIGDPAIEDLFALIQHIGPENVKVIIAPNDLRTHIPVKNPHLKIIWLKDLYNSIGHELSSFQKPVS